MRHILMIDIRPEQEHDSLHIRGSFHVDLATFAEEDLLELVLKTAKSFAEYNPKENDTLRRLLVVTKGPLASEDPAVEKLTKMVKSLNCITHIVSLRDGIDSVAAKYPFLLVSKSSANSDHGFAASRFPSVVSEGKVFLGGLLNAGATRQLEALGITTLIGVGPDALTNVSKKFKYVHFAFTENKGDQQMDLLDFETIVETIAEGIENGERVLVFSVVCVR